MAAAESADDAPELTEDEAQTKLRSHGYPGVNTQVSIRNFHCVWSCYQVIRESGRRRADQLLTHAPSPTVDAPEKGLYVDQREWLENVANPALTAMPDIDAPDASDRDWVFLADTDDGAGWE